MVMVKIMMSDATLWRFYDTFRRGGWVKWWMVIMVMNIKITSINIRVFHSGIHAIQHCDDINDYIDHPPFYLVDDDFAMPIIPIIRVFRSGSWVLKWSCSSTLPLRWHQRFWQVSWLRCWSIPSSECFALEAGRLYLLFPTQLLMLAWSGSIIFMLRTMMMAVMLMTMLV